MEECANGCGRPATRVSRVHDGRVCKVCYTKEWHARQGECSLGHCDRKINAGGLCETHYSRKRRGLPDWDAEIPRRMKRVGKCAHEAGNCPEPVYARGWCRLHYHRVTRLGYADAGPVGLMKAAAGEGGDDGRGYHNITVNGKKYLEHRYVMEQQLRRPLWPDETVHHRNGQRSDNRPENLELWAKAQPAGQRVTEIMDYWVSRYPDEARRVLARLKEG